jgi:hypothetical protein
MDWSALPAILKAVSALVAVVSFFVLLLSGRFSFIRKRRRQTVSSAKDTN